MANSSTVADIVRQGNDRLIAPEENSTLVVPDHSDNVKKDIQDYFEVIGDFDRKCNLCSREIRLNTTKSVFNLKRHFKSKHHAEWTKLEPFMNIRKPKTANANSNVFELISPEEAQLMENAPINVYFDNDNENMDPNGFDHVPAKGVKRAKFEDDIGGDNGAIRPQMGNNTFVKNDEFDVFGFFVASEMRNLKTVQCRQELKHAFTKCLLEVAEKDAVLAVKRDE